MRAGDRESESMASHQAHEHGHGHHHDDHHHGHHHGHSHAPATFGSAFAIATVLNLALVAIQAAYGVLAHSMALLADAGHNAGDVLALVLAWGSHAISQKHPTERYTYGFRSSSIIAALINATILLVVTGAIAWAALERLFAPQPVAGATVMVVAALAIVFNGAAAAILARGNTSDLNVYGAFLHLVADAAVSAGVVVAGLVILLTGWLWVDPVASLVISGVIVWSTWGLLRDAAKMSLQGVPPQIDTGAVRVLSLAGAHDVGRAINPLLIEGQIEGGLVQGLGFALMEEVRQEYGRPTGPDLAHYLVPTALDVPELIALIVETHEPTGPLGAKGVGEAGLVPTAAAIANAVEAATGARVTDLPITPERVLAALKNRPSEPAA
jgi:cobalt-zinc-cadmium efflux system protein